MNESFAVSHLHVPEVGAHVVGVVPELDGDDGAVAHDEGLAKVPIYSSNRHRDLRNSQFASHFSHFPIFPLIFV